MTRANLEVYLMLGDVHLNQCNRNDLVDIVRTAGVVCSGWDKERLRLWCRDHPDMVTASLKILQRERIESVRSHPTTRSRSENITRENLSLQLSNVLNALTDDEYKQVFDLAVKIQGDKRVNLI